MSGTWRDRIRNIVAKTTAVCSTMFDTSELSDGEAGDVADARTMRTDIVRRAALVREGTDAVTSSDLSLRIDGDLHTRRYARYPEIGAVFDTPSRAATLRSRPAPNRAELSVAELGSVWRLEDGGPLQCGRRSPAP